MVVNEGLNPHYLMPVCHSYVINWQYQLFFKGWLLDRFQAQARGLDGGLDKWWPQISKSAWMPNGNGTVPGLEAPSTERVPYWLNGMVPLHTLLSNSDPSSPEAVGIGASTKRYIFHILANQDPVRPKHHRRPPKIRHILAAVLPLACTSTSGRLCRSRVSRV